MLIWQDIDLWWLISLTVFRITYNTNDTPLFVCLCGHLLRGLTEERRPTLNIEDTISWSVGMDRKGGEKRHPGEKGHFSTPCFLSAILWAVPLQPTCQNMMNRTLCCLNSLSFNKQFLSSIVVVVISTRKVTTIPCVFMHRETTCSIILRIGACLRQLWLENIE